tara:strand:+ start:423 stop:605 length:183 start_codon:yes stop_codon:yes gene_type:complete
MISEQLFPTNRNQKYQEEKVFKKKSHLKENGISKVISGMGAKSIRVGEGDETEVPRVVMR